MVTILGPENHESHSGKHKTTFEEGGGDDGTVVDDNDEHICTGPSQIWDRQV